jgi:hypothetical protein
MRLFPMNSPRPDMLPRENAGVHSEHEPGLNRRVPDGCAARRPNAIRVGRARDLDLERVRLAACECTSMRTRILVP